MASGYHETTTVQLLKSYSNTNYSCVATIYGTGSTAWDTASSIVFGTIATSSFSIKVTESGNAGISGYKWRTAGYIN